MSGYYNGGDDDGVGAAAFQLAHRLDYARGQYLQGNHDQGVSRVVQALTGSLLAPARPRPTAGQRWYEIRNTVAVDTAEVHVYGDVGDGGVTAAEFIRELAGIDAGEITLRINSGGGQVFDGLAIHNALRSHPARVTVYVDALAASIASVIAMAGDRVIMREHSQLMIHDARSWLGDSSPQQMREYADFLDRQSDNLADVYVRRAGGTRGQWRERMRQDTWYSAAEAVAAGLADEVRS